MSNVVEKLARLRDDISSVAHRYGRNPDEILLVAVTKFAQIEDIEAAYNAGHRDFGENYVQKVIPKVNALPNDINWHFIGAVQKNKINKILGRFVLVHSIDSVHIAKQFELRAAREGINQRVLIEVKTSYEATKHGIEPDRTPELAQYMRDECPHLLLDGLMTIAPYTADKDEIVRCFKTVQTLREKLELRHLSMGMTNDWQLAIEYGATILRIGSAIFSKMMRIDVPLST